MGIATVMDRLIQQALMQVMTPIFDPHSSPNIFGFRPRKRAHDAVVARKVTGKRVLILIRAYLNAGVMVDGILQETLEGTPQGGPLSPLLANILLDDLDKELTEEG